MNRMKRQVDATIGRLVVGYCTTNNCNQATNNSVNDNNNNNNLQLDIRYYSSGEANWIEVVPVVRE